MKRLCVLLMLAPSVARADDDATTQKEEEADAAEVDYAVPATPAFDFLGASPTQVTHPGTLRDLGVDLINAVGTDGSVQQGFALEVRPTPLFWAPNREDAVKQTLKYRLSRLHLSLATQKSVVPDGMTVTGNPTDSALGLRWTIVDRSDPWSDLDFRSTVSNAIEECAPEQPPTAANQCDPGENCGTTPTPTDEEDETDFGECLEEKLSELREEFEEAHWNALRIEAGLAGGFRLPDSKLNGDAFWLGEQAWASASFGLGCYGEIALSLRGAIRREAETGPSQKELSGGTRLFLGWNRFHVFGEGVFQLRRDSMGAERDGDWGLGLEINVMSKTWVAIGFGNVLDDEEDVQMLASVRWAVSDQERFTRPQ